jgi:hypothetical protein
VAAGLISAEKKFWFKRKQRAESGKQSIFIHYLNLVVNDNCLLPSAFCFLFMKLTIWERN